jgi:hypothetical protein
MARRGCQPKRNAFPATKEKARSRESTNAADLDDDVVDNVDSSFCLFAVANVVEVLAAPPIVCLTIITHKVE